MTEPLDVTESPDQASSSSSAWRLIVHSELQATEQMRYDLRLAEDRQPTLRLFWWPTPAVSLGLNQSVPAWIDPIRLAEHGIDLVERPTGGGLAVHGSDLSCSIVVPQALTPSLTALLDRVAERFVVALRRLEVEADWVSQVSGSERIQYCLTERSPYALVVGDRKLCGFAIRRLPGVWLIQGSLLVRALPDCFGLVIPPAVRAEFRDRAISLEEATGGTADEEELIHQLALTWGSLLSGAIPGSQDADAPTTRLRNRIE